MDGFSPGNFWKNMYFKMKHPIMRGVDTWGRNFLLIKYYNLTDKKEIAEKAIKDNAAANVQVISEENALLFFLFFFIIDIISYYIKFYIEYTKRFVLQN